MNINLTYIIPEGGGILNEQNIDNELFKNDCRNQEEDVMDNNEDAGCYSTGDQHTISSFHSCNLSTVVLARGEWMPISNNATPSTISPSTAVTPDIHDNGKYPEDAAERSNKAKSCTIQGINTRFLGEELSQECLQDDVEDEDFEMDDKEEDVINKPSFARAASIEYDADGTPTDISFPVSLHITGASDGSFRSSLTSRWNSRVSGLGFGSFSAFKSFSKEISSSKEGPEKIEEEEVHHENLICGSF
jgi:hypothetical protein